MDTLIGRTINSKFKILSLLGKGGMGEIYLAEQVSLARTVAVKVLRTERHEEPEQFHKRFFLEASLCAKLNHPNIVTVYDYGRIEDTGPETYFLAMEYLKGQTLQQRLESTGVMSLREVLELATQVVRGLREAHRNGLIHRDLKPSNIMACEGDENHYKILDFGLVKQVDAEQELTKAGTFVGSPKYMSPEQGRGLPVDARTDFYSLGVIMYLCLTGTVPFERTTPVQTLIAHINDPVPAMASRNALIAVPPKVEAFVLNLLEKDPEDRPESADVLIRRIRRLRADLFGDGSLTATEIVDDSSSRSRGVAVSLTPSGSGRSSLIGADATRSDPVASQRARINGRLGIYLGGAVLLTGIFAIILVLAFHNAKKEVSTIAASVSSSPSAPVVAAKVLLRLHGSNTIGARLGPDMVAAFMSKKGFAGASSRSTDKDLQVVEARQADGSVVQIEVFAPGSKVAFEDLDSGKCDIGMASRAISDDEVTKLARLGNMRMPATEHVVALDGIAVIVHRNNPVNELSRTDISKIFAGEVTNWKEINPTAGDIPIHLFARDDKSGTFDTFKNVVLQGKKLASAQRFENSDELSDKVSTDTGGIGFIGLPYVRSSKALKVSDGPTTAFLPNQFTVATEDYPISRRLYLYSMPNSSNPLVNEFIEFALSDEGQKVVEAHGFIRANADEMTNPTCTSCSYEYKSITQNARRVSINFRFRAGGRDLDTKAIRDLDRVVTMLRNRPDLASKQVLLLGFSDNDGDPQRNLQLSLERATIVANELRSRGIQPAVIKGFGDQSPVATNLTPEGKEKNRRVELWFQ